MDYFVLEVPTVGVNTGYVLLVNALTEYYLLLSIIIKTYFSKSTNSCPVNFGIS